MILNFGNVDTCVNVNEKVSYCAHEEWGHLILYLALQTVGSSIHI